MCEPEKKNFLTDPTEIGLHLTDGKAILPFVHFPNIW